MLNSKISKYVQNYINNKEVTPSEAKELYHRFERVLNNNENLKKVGSFFFNEPYYLKYLTNLG